MSSSDERPAVMLGLLILFGLAVLSAAVPVVGHVLLGLLIALVVGLVARFVVLWWRTRWEPPDKQNRPTTPATPVARSSEREVA